jgi:hypothetical protein
MKNLLKGISQRLCYIVLYSFCLFFVSLNLEAAEKTLILGASAGWGTVEKRVQVEEKTAVRPHAVLALSSAMQAGRPGTTGGSGKTGGGAAAAGIIENTADDILALYTAYRNFPVQESALDLDVSFDEGRPDRFSDNQGNYRIRVSGAAQSANERLARYGRGAALFTGEDRYYGAPITIQPTLSSLFAPGRSIRDFSLEFWLYPGNMENGEQIIAWTAAENQRILCEASKNRIRWTFQELFAPPEKLRQTSGIRAGNNGSIAGERPRLVIAMESRGSIIPRRWSHHLIRYNADTGLLEYLVDGRIENMAYTTANGREGGDVYTPLINRDGAFVLGSRFSGMLDEFRIYNKVINAPGHTTAFDNTSLELPELAKFPREGGRIETRSIDLGKPGSVVLKIEASGGRLGSGGRGITGKNIYMGKTNFRFPDDSTLQFFIRAGEDQYRFSQIPWIPLIPGETVPNTIKGRYVQLAVAFYPSRDCETSPYLEEVRIGYNSNEAPYPPALVSARALDGAVELSWRVSPDEDVSGYLIYYGTSSGVYYGQGTALGASPIDAGNRTSLRIDGLQNGTLYFFAVIAYNGTGLRPDGKFSREISARPLRTGG